MCARLTIEERHLELPGELPCLDKMRLRIRVSLFDQERPVRQARLHQLVALVDALEHVDRRLERRLRPQSFPLRRMHLPQNPKYRSELVTIADLLAQGGAT